MYIIFRVVLPIFLVCLFGVGATVLYMHKKIFVGVSMSFLLLCIIYIFFFSTSPMKPKVNEENIDQYVIEIVNEIKSMSTQNLDKNDWYTLAYQKNNIEYNVDVEYFSEQEFAESRFLSNTHNKEYFYDVQRRDNIEYCLSPCFIGREWRYLGVPEQTFGDIVVLYDNYVVNIRYYYVNEGFFSELICPLETFYREEVDLQGHQSGDGSMIEP